MSDIKNALAQLRAARNGEEAQITAQAPPPVDAAAQTVALTHSDSPAPVTDPEVAPRGEAKTLAGRVPLSLHRELTRALLDAADELRVSRINVDEALEAAMRVVLRDDQATALWYAQLKEVRRERREG